MHSATRRRLLRTGLAVGIACLASSAQNARADVPAYQQHTGVDNPLDGFTLAGGGSFPTMGDLDGDGDADLIAGDGDGFFAYFENVGAPGAPEFQERFAADNPLDGVVVGELSFPEIADLNGDGLPDLVVGAGLRYFENIGAPDAPVFVERFGENNPLGAIGIALRLDLVDLDGDGDLDGVVSEGLGEFRYYENIGDPDAAQFVLQSGSDNPLRALSLGAVANTSAADFDGDGDFDLLVGVATGSMRYFDNTGNPRTPVFTERNGVNNPFVGQATSGVTVPTFADLDGDGDPDVIAGSTSANFSYFVNPNRPAQIGGTLDDQDVDDVDEIAPFTAVVLSDADGDDVEVVVEINANLGRFTDLNGFSDEGAGRYRLATTDLATAQTALRGMVFAPTENRVPALTTDVILMRVIANDGAFASRDQGTRVDSLSLNDAPVLDSSGAPTLPTIAADVTSANNVGTTIDTILAGDIVSDVDPSAAEGIAIVAATSDKGTWEFSTTGVTWTPIETVATSSAVLLAANGLTRLRFQPSEPGPNTATIAFLAWDRTSGFDGQANADATLAGGRTAFSLAFEIASIDVVDEPFCGDGLPAFGEECDNGAANSDTDPDACRTDCTLPRCGDAVIDSGETCDDGNTSDGDSCPTSCEPATCGDGFVQSGVEECDQGDANSDSEPDACRSDCRAPRCGDDIIDSGETCDDGENNSDTEVDACRTHCALPTCGDGILDPGEACDEGDANSDTAAGACRNTCTRAFCGDGVVDEGEACDQGMANSDFNADACRSDCSTPTCGDAVVDSGEDCDEGIANRDGEDGVCNTQCKLPNVYARGGGLSCSASAGESTPYTWIFVLVLSLGALRRRRRRKA